MPLGTGSADTEKAGSLPSISLPKGGGAIRDIGETFSVSAATGTGSMSVPVPTSPGRGELSAHLALAYDTGTGNGPFGLGWSMSMPSISRRTDKQIPRYLDAQESDTYLITGAEDLVPVFTGAGKVWNQDVRTEGGVRIERYRPRTEGLFARIERHVELATGEVHWRSVGKDNVTTAYGRSAATRIADPADPARVFRWLIDETRDDRGNIVVYEYKQENAAGIDLTLPYEKYRIANSNGFANRYLKRIRYGNTAPNVADAWTFTVVLDYGEHDAVKPTPQDEPVPWPVRADPFSACRPGFEIRTYRLCRRILMFHTFAELGATPCLVKSTDLAYAQTPTASFLTSVTQRGYIRDAATGAYASEALPPIEFGYAERTLHTTVQEVDAESLKGLPDGLDGTDYQWVDLDGEGIAGILSERTAAWYYKRNHGAGTFAPAEQVATLPATAQVMSRSQQLLQLAGDGHTYLVDFTSALPGYQERDDGAWAPFTPFSALPRIAWDDPNLRFADLNGDGFSDVLITGTDLWRWHASRARDGFAPAETLVREVNEDRGPALVFADGTQSTYVADMSGDGLADIVRVRNGEIAYWPNLGWGRFGAKVTMLGSPLFDLPERFDQKRIRLCDVDGSGTTDIVYLGDAPRLWFNECGNGWSAAQPLPSFPRTVPLANVLPVDLLGSGTSCLVWSSNDPADARRPMRYVDLMGGVKPFLLDAMKNNLGHETAIGYATSTKFYLQDEAAGTPWITKLPFPVHVVERVETRDLIADTKLVTTYRYRHGYYDGFEREFRGFAYVEQRDTDSFSKFNGAGLFAAPPRIVDDRMYVPPVLTKTWYHAGYLLDVGNISQHYAQEYYAGDAQAVLLPDSTIPSDLNAQETQEACRALRTHKLREEVYGLDESPLAGDPYVVSEHTYEVRELQPLLANQYAVYHPYERASVSYHYERRADDPRIVSELTDVDGFGNTIESASVAYRRRVAAFPEQAETKIAFTVHDVINRAADLAFYQAGFPSDTRTYELTGGPAPAKTFYTLDELRGVLDHGKQLAYEATDVPATPAARIIKRTRTTYRADNAGAELAPGALGVPGLPFQTFEQALTPGLVTAVFGVTVDDALLRDECKFAQLDGDWYAPSGTHVFDPAKFFGPTSYTDPFGGVSTLAYDAETCLPVGSTDALGNTVTAKNNYRVLHPYAVTDPNGNRTVVRFDALGMVVATAVTGKPGGADGDVMDDAFAEALPADDPTTRLVYDLTRFVNDGTPPFVHTFVREQHGAANPRWQESYTYSDGSGREALKKIQAEPDPAAPAQPRWIGTGRTIFDNKGNAVKKYEPYFSDTPAWEAESAIVTAGVTPIFRYDPLGRKVRTDLPNGTFSTVEFDAWKQVTSDENDTVLDSAWYAAREALAAGDPERRAADVTAPHANTPGVAHLDPLSRAARTIVDDGGGATLVTVHARDIEGNQRSVVDPRGIIVAQQTYDMLGRKLLAHSADAGEARTLLDAGGAIVRSWDSRGYAIRMQYDVLRRTTHVYAKSGAAPEYLRGRTVYGEGLADGAARNLHDKVYQEYDFAGVSTMARCDFKGNVVEASRRLARTLHAEPDWSTLAALVAPADVVAAAEALLEPETFTTRTAYDALNRVTALTTPDASVTRPSYNEANLIERIDVAVRGGAEQPFVANVDYNAKGQRVLIEFGNGTRTTFDYDPETFRLDRLLTRLGATALQDLTYTYDPGGRVVEVADAAQQTVFFDNAVVEATGRYTYDPAYRLAYAEGREHSAAASVWQPDATEITLQNLPHANDLQAIRRWNETYAYDESGNLEQVVHAANAGGWTRRQKYALDSNRLLSSSVPADAPGVFSQLYQYDAHGNMTQMPNLSVLDWNAEDQLAHLDLGGGGAAYYTYGSKGVRVRRTIERVGGTSIERIYLGSVEIYRERDAGGSVVLERQTLHVMDGSHRIALVETKTRDGGAVVGAPVPVTRYQLGNNLASVLLETDEHGNAISYEEYFPFGATSYRSARPAAGVSLKRYRYIGIERDDESGLYASGARYYAPWLGRWTSCDPAGLTDGVNVYVYVNNNPLALSDPTGMWGWREVAVIAAVVVVGTIVTVATAGAAGPLVVGAIASIGLTGTAATVATGVVVGAVAGAVGGAAAGAVGETTRQVVHNQTLGLGHEHMSAGRIANAAGRGAVEGAAVGAAIGGVTAFAATAAGAATVGAIGRVAQRVVPGAVRGAGGTLARGAVSAARTVARAPGVRQAVSGVSRGLAAVAERSTAAGMRAAGSVFTEGSAGANAVARLGASGGNVAAVFDAAPKPTPSSAVVATETGGITAPEPRVHDIEYTTSRHTAGGKQVARDLAKGREAHIFNEGTDFDALERRVWAEGTQQPDVRGHSRYTLESPEPIGRRVQTGRPDVPLHTTEIKGKWLDGKFEFHMDPRSRPAR